jgi:hypothetical protein
MPVTVQRWEELITGSLQPSRLTVIPLADEVMEAFIQQSERERDNARNLLIEGIINRPQIRDKQQFVQLNQAMLIRLLDSVYRYTQTKGLEQKVVDLYSTIVRHLEATLQFIEEFFGNYFDRNENVPLSYFHYATRELSRQTQLLKTKLENVDGVDATLIAILIKNFNRICERKTGTATYNELVYQRSLMNELLSEETAASEGSIGPVLYFFNFNDDDYIAYIYRQFTNLLDLQPTKQEKIAALRYEQKKINQLRTKLYTRLNPDMPSLKEQVNQWMDEEIKYLAAEAGTETTPKGENEPEDKIHTSLSVAKLALLLRLMVIDKMIVNRVVAQVLRITVKTVTSVKRENIAFGSLETKYHHPDSGTINAVKDMLFKWINILNKL